MQHSWRCNINTSKLALRAITSVQQSFVHSKLYGLRLESSRLVSWLLVTLFQSKQSGHSEVACRHEHVSVSLGVCRQLQVAWDQNTVLVIRCNSIVLLVQVVHEHMKCCISIVRRASDPERHRQHDSRFALCQGCSMWSNQFSDCL